MMYSEYNIEQWKEFISNYIDELLLSFGKSVDTRTNEALTGSYFCFSSNDMYELYNELCSKTGLQIKLYSKMDFYTIDNIANCLYNNFHGFSK